LLDIIQQRQAQQTALASKEAERRLSMAQAQEAAQRARLLPQQQQILDQLRQAQAAELQARTKRTLKEIEHPELITSGLPEIARQRAHVEALKKAYGADSQIVKEAQADLDLVTHNLESQMGYRKALANFLPKRGLTSPSRAMMEKAYIESGVSPTGLPFALPEAPLAQTPTPHGIAPKTAGVPAATPTMENKLTKKSKEDLVKAQKSPFGSEDSALLTLYLSKQAGLTDNLKKLSFGSNVETTLDLMMPYRYAVAYYSGVKGRKRYAADMISSQTTGRLTPELRDFKRFTEMAHTTLIPQITQYYGLSITEHQQEILRNATNLANWKNAPETTMVALDSLIKTLESEIQVRRDLVSKPSFLTKKHAETAPLYDQIKATGYSFEEIIKKADERHIPIMA